MEKNDKANTGKNTSNHLINAYEKNENSFALSFF